MKRIVLTALAALTVITASTPALAWGAREQGILAGIAGTILVQEITRDRQPQVHTAPPVISHRGTYHPMIIAPNIDPRVYRPQMQPPVQYMCPVFDMYGNVVGHRWCH